MSGNLFLGDESMDDASIAAAAASATAAAASTATSDPEPAAPSSAAGPSNTSLPPDSERVASLPIYISDSLLPTSSLHLFQYPIYPRDRPLPIPTSAASRGLKVASRWRPGANRVEVELPLDVRAQVYNAERGTELGSNKKLEKMRLESSHVPHMTNYTIGVIRDHALHLTRLEAVHQLRPSMHYLDALDEAKKRQDRPEEDDEEEDENELIEMEEGGRKKAPKKTPAAQTLSVAMRRDPNAKRAPGMGFSASTEARDQLMAAQREADAERWVDLQWRTPESTESEEVFNAQLFADSKAPLDCKTRPREYLIEVQ